jgi:hypothetical protein
MADQIRRVSPDDIIRWPDGTICARQELHEYAWMSDDYEVIPADSPEWVKTMEREVPR